MLITKLKYNVALQVRVGFQKMRKIPQEYAW